MPAEQALVMLAVEDVVHFSLSHGSVSAIIEFLSQNWIFEQCPQTVEGGDVCEFESALVPGLGKHYV